ncbi:TraR/DksA family transcriptional regulator [Bacillus sp. FJAT-42376]|uniref:TraR/DksA family transcriptional regulator n=1 Tax=Bacillus sp. FJAT-42376 TaxID=2014076 RepID=UPI000F4FE511|nr:TraR/DksA family transcriptional regulator [Bacillus sp. FJAT-42376]AZB44836.1 TraR/DksA family transcriptional regulator [Bacillus sp. FJAT-42376]
MREELQERLFDHSFFESQTSETCHGTIMYHVKEELHDVEHALNKMDSGMYGICEETGELLPYSSLKYLPTARSIHDFSYKDQYEKKSLPLNFREMDYHSEHVEGALF